MRTVQRGWPKIFQFLCEIEESSCDSCEKTRTETNERNTGKKGKPERSETRLRSSLAPKNTGSDFKVFFSSSFWEFISSFFLLLLRFLKHKDNKANWKSVLFSIHLFYFNLELNFRISKFKKWHDQMYKKNKFKTSYFYKIIYVQCYTFIPFKTGQRADRVLNFGQSP